MAGSSDVKRRIKSVENTRQITRTMELVATSKLKKATDRVRAAAPYSDALASVVRSLYAPELSEKFPLFRRPEKVERAAVLLLTANRGLAGGFNANLIKEARLLLGRLSAEGVETDLHIVGKKGIAYFRFRGHPIASTRIDIGDHPSMEDAESVIGGLRDEFADRPGRRGAHRELGVHLGHVDPPEGHGVAPDRGQGSDPRSRGVDNFILTPKAEVVLDRLLPAYLRNATYRALVENVAAEQGARRSAMKSATDNAGDVLEYLTRSYNRARQGQITQEIAEIVGGAAALE